MILNRLTLFFWPYKKLSLETLAPVFLSMASQLWLHFIRADVRGTVVGHYVLEPLMQDAWSFVRPFALRKVVTLWGDGTKFVVLARVHFGR